MSNPSISLKLLIDAKSGIVLFAETTENIAAVIKDILSKPDTVISLFRQQETAAGSLANLCKSIENVSMIKTWSNEIYCCANSCYFEYSDDKWATCPHCFEYMNRRLEYVAPAASGSGGVYIITDDLEMMPMSAISIVTLFKRLGVKDTDAFQEQVVHFGVHEAIKLVNASLQSKKVLTDVFLKAQTVKTESDGVWNPEQRNWGNFDSWGRFEFFKS